MSFWSLTCGALSLNKNPSSYQGNLLPELGTRQYCQDNATMLSGQNTVWFFQYYYIFCGYPILTPKLNHFSNFFWSLNFIIMSHCLCPTGKKLSRAQLCMLPFIFSEKSRQYCWCIGPQIGPGGTRGTIRVYIRVQWIITLPRGSCRCLPPPLERFQGPQGGTSEPTLTDSPTCQRSQENYW